MKLKATLAAFGLAAVVLGVIFVYSYMAERPTREISYGEFKTLLRGKRVERAVLFKDRITGELTVEDAGSLVAMKDAQLSKSPEKAQKERLFTTRRVEDPRLVDELDRLGVSYRSGFEHTWVMTLISWVAPAGILMLGAFLFFRKMGYGSGTSRLFVEKKSNVTFPDVAGVAVAEEELREIIEFLRNPSRFQNLGCKIPKGVLLVGPPGSGKTLLAQAVAGEANVPFFSISGSAFVEMFAGVGAARVRNLFARAAKKSPCIIFIDEIDAVGKAREGIAVSGAEEHEQTLTQLLTQMDGFDTKKGVIILAATNRPEILDPALLRPGRFDRHIVVDRPDLKGREQIFKIHARNLKLARDVDFKGLAATTPGMVGAEIANVVNEAALLAVRRNKETVQMSDFKDGIERVSAGLEKTNKLINAREKEIVAYHEAGHAIVSLSLPQADPVHKISIIPRGISALGYTVHLPTEDRYLLTQSELLDKITVLLGGRASEEVIFGEVSTASQSDLEEATEIARSMVQTYGMSDKVGPLTFEKGRPLFLDTKYSPLKEYSEHTAMRIDEEVYRIVNQTYQTAKQILASRRLDLEKVARALVEKEVIDRNELDRILVETN
ncbi:MAG TPA: ATP-dependent metallopeptidase FtsH/Yme1/Tma family protein [Proteobacteria bacterium]|nr:ATP-dependent metallopeptidase FtsH/Yme1/Tma family protein [Pseudomonadota bacterium]